MPKQMRGRYSKQKGNRGELKVINKLKELTGNQNLTSTRLSSKALDNAGVDVFDPDGVLPFYVQVKVTQQNPKYPDLIQNVKVKDRPLAIFHNKQIKKEQKCISGGSYVIMEESAFLELFKAVINDKAKKEREPDNIK